MSKANDPHEQRLEGVRKLFRPLVAFCVRRSVKLPELVEVLKILFVEAAEKELAKASTPLSASRISAMTGVHRKDISRLSREDENPKSPQNTIARVMTQWRYDARFCSRPGTPRPLQLEGRDSEFSQLVHSVLGGDLSGYAILYEMERIGVVKKEEGKATLLWKDFAPIPAEVDGISYLANDVNGLLLAVEENIFQRQAVPSLHLRTVFDNIVAEAIPSLRQWILQEGSAFHEKVSRFLAEHDVDLNPTLKDKPAGQRIVVGSFGNIQAPEDAADPLPSIQTQENL